MTKEEFVQDPMRSVGERWFADQTPFRDDMPRYWGEWGVDSECGTLKSVLLRRPGPEVEDLTDARAVRFRALPDVEKMRDQHDQLAELYRSFGVQVHYVEEMRADKPNGMFLRDLCVTTPEGAIVTRPALHQRRGEERYVAQSLARLGVPIVRTINGRATFEGADLMWVNGETAFLGLGNRSNLEGCQQVEAELRRMGVEDIIYVQVPYGQAHMDGVLNIADRDIAVCFPWQTPFVAADALRRRGFRILEVANVRELRMSMSVNFVALAPGVIVMAHGSPEAVQMYEEAGIEVIQLDVSELMKGWGSVHCLTAFLRREPL